MTAQPQPVAVPLEGGINEEAALTVVSQPVVIENARYARTGSLSKRNGYALDTSAPLPTTPYSAPDHEFVAFDGDKFVARKTPTGMAFYQRRGVNEVAFLGRDQRELGVGSYTSAGTTSRLRPALDPLPAIEAVSPHEGLLCDLALPTEFMGLQGQVYVYVRLEMVSYDNVKQGHVFDIVVEYLDASDARLTVREPSRLKNKILYVTTKETAQQVRVLQRGTTFDALTILYTTDDDSGTGIFANQLIPGTDAASDVWGAVVPIVTDTVAVPTGGTPVFKRPLGEWDCDAFLASSSTQSFSVLFSTQYGVAWTRIDSMYPLAGAVYRIWYPDPFFNVAGVSLAMTGLQNGLTQEVAFAVVSERTGSGIQECYGGRFNALAGGAPTGISAGPKFRDDALAGRVRPHSAVAGRIRYDNGAGGLNDSYLVGVNTDLGFRYAYGDKGVATLYGNVHCIACAWATGRPHTVFNARGDFLRVAMPMVSFGGVNGGGAGLLADVTPRGNYGTVAPENVLNGAPLLATYAIDQVALSLQTVASTLTSSGPAPIRTASFNGGLHLKPIHGSEFPTQGDYAAPRWLTALGAPPVATMLSLRENQTDFEFIEPGVMLTGPGVPLMLDTVHGVSELGFHTSPPLLLISGFTVTAGTGYASGVILQYRFQYRFVDGNGRAQVSAPTDPILITSTNNDSTFFFRLAPHDVTLRHRGAVMIDVYRTDDREATFYWIGSVYSDGGSNECIFYDRGPSKVFPDRTRTINVENFSMTPPCASHSFRGAFRDVLVTRENELWPSKRRLSTTAPQFDIIDAAAWDSTEPVITGGEIDGKLVLLSKSRIAYTYELNGVLAPFVDIPSDAGAVDGSRAFSTHLGIFYQAPVGIRIVGRDLALHEVGMPLLPRLRSAIIRGGIKVPRQGEIRLRLDDGRTYLVFDYLHGDPGHPVWYVNAFNEQGSYDDEDGTVHPTGLRAVADQAFAPDGRLLYLCRLGFLLEETTQRHRDEDQWVPMRVRSGPMRGATALSYLATIEAAVNLELPPTREPGPVTLRLFGDYEDSVPLQPTVERAWTIAEIEAFDRRQLQITSGERVMNAPSATVEYSDENPGNVDAVADGFGYRLSSVVMVYGQRDQKTIFPVANGARK